MFNRLKFVSTIAKKNIKYFNRCLFPTFSYFNIDVIYNGGKTIATDTIDSHFEIQNIEIRSLKSN